MTARVLLLVLSSIVTLLFFLYGFNCYYLLAARRRYRSPVPAEPCRPRPKVSVHLPVYNERYVVARLLTAVAGMAEEYGKEAVRILVLDDSDDDTREEVDRQVSLLASRGFRIEAARRQGRAGYKAGALQAALERTTEDYFAVFDADFLPPRGFLAATVPHLEADPGLAVVQARWDHLNGDYSPLTRALSIGIDAHFLIEQPARYAAGCFLNFNGSCGLIRRRALEEAGGWQADTLAEDLDVSYRMQLAGYRILYLRELACEGEVPPSVPSFVRQQARWACGSLRVARKLLPRLLSAPGLALRTRLQGFLHLTYYRVHPLMYASFLLACLGAIIGMGFLGAPGSSPPIAGSAPVAGSPRLVPILLAAAAVAAICACSVAVWLYPVVCVKARGRSIWKSLPSMLLLVLIGFGVSLSNTVEAGKALLSRRAWEFVRTPKYALRRATDRWKGKSYQASLRSLCLLEAASAILGTVSIVAAALGSGPGLVPILAVYTASFSFLAVLGWLQSAGPQGGGR